MGYELPVGDKSVTVYSFFMSTVHTVVFVSDAFAFDYNEIGHAIAHHPLYREQTNVNFVQIVDAHTLQMVTYERGVGYHAGMWNRCRCRSTHRPREKGLCRQI